jgi:hypothetical protein
MKVLVLGYWEHQNSMSHIPQMPTPQTSGPAAGPATGAPPSDSLNPVSQVPSSGKLNLPFMAMVRSPVVIDDAEESPVSTFAFNDVALIAECDQEMPAVDIPQVCSAIDPCISCTDISLERMWCHVSLHGTSSTFPTPGY